MAIYRTEQLSARQSQSTLTFVLNGTIECRLHWISPVERILLPLSLGKTTGSQYPSPERKAYQKPHLRHSSKHSVIHSECLICSKRQGQRAVETRSSVHQNIVIKKKNRQGDMYDMGQNGDLGQVRSGESGLGKAGGEAMPPWRPEGQC